MVRVKTTTLAVITLVLIFGGIGLSKALGFWLTESSKEPARFATGEAAGQYNPADIRGSYTWDDIERAFGLPAAEAARVFSPAGQTLSAGDQVNVLEDLYAGVLPEDQEIGTDSVRLFVALYKNLPYTPEEGTVLPKTALTWLSSQAGVDPLRLEAVTTVELRGTGTGLATATEDEHDSDARVVAGKTTFGEIYDWGVTESHVKDAIGFAPGPRTQSIRDAAVASGVEFSVIKTALQALVDAQD